MRKIIYKHSDGTNKIVEVRNILKNPLADNCYYVWDTMVDGPLPNDFDIEKLQGYVRIENTLYFDKDIESKFLLKEKSATQKINEKKARRLALSNISYAKNLEEIKTLLSYLAKEMLDIDQL